MSDFKSVEDVGELDELFERSNERPVVVFKHSSTCPISSNAYQTMEQVADPVSIIVVQRARNVSREIEDRTGVAHESPQVIILRNGAAVWSASHWRIDAAKIDDAVNINR